MPPSSPDIDFARIRPYGQPATRASGFEELASILIRDGVVDWPEGTKFHRFGNPDGGREGKGVLSNGEVWAWQAKYLFEFDSSAVGQVSESVRRTFQTEPKLTRYFVSLPMDLPAGDTAARTSAFKRWSNSVASWQAEAREVGLDVEFVFVGAHELLTVLTDSRHAGRARYWFDAEMLDDQRQREHIEEVVRSVGRRYSPELHVELDIVQVMDAVARTRAFVERWRVTLAEIRKAIRYTWRAPEGYEESYENALAEAKTAMDAVDLASAEMIAAAQTTETLPDLEPALTRAQDAVRVLQRMLREHEQSGGYYVGTAGMLYSSCRDASGALYRVESLGESVSGSAAREGRLLITGRAGVGKTHLLCDIARSRVTDGLPTIMLLGPDFDARSLASQLGELAGIVGSTADVLAVLDAAGQAVGEKALLIIDAINESEKPERWPAVLRVLVTQVARFPHVSLVVSCRTEFLAGVVASEIEPAIEHYGFGEATEIAVRRFATEYGLEPPSFPILNPEFSNPLFLRLTCESLVTLGAERFRFGAAGLSTVCDSFLEAVNMRLAAPDRGDFDAHEMLVGRVVRELAMINARQFDRSQVRTIADSVLPNREYSRSLLKGMIAEGVLIEVGTDRLAFGYQRLGEVARANYIAERDLEGIRDWIKSLGSEVWIERGTIGALAVILPELHQVEIFDLVSTEQGYPRFSIEAFLEGLTLREPGSIRDSGIDMLGHLLTVTAYSDQVFDRAVRLACIPGHPLNADWFHDQLVSKGMTERDVSWSRWLIGATEEDYGSPVLTFLEWAWPRDPAHAETIPGDVGALALVVAAWLTSTSDRRVRDRATKAMVSIGERAPGSIATLIPRLGSVDDPYVVERAAAAVCAIALRDRKPDCLQPLADQLAAFVASGWPQHLLTRDYIHRVLRLAVENGWAGAAGAPPYGATWPVEALPLEEIETMAGPPNRDYASVWYSIQGMGDFGRYIIQPAARGIALEDGEADDFQHLLERAVFTWVVKLGWTPSVFGDIDDRRWGGHDDGPVERVGKKYQWIALYEILGALVDTHLVSDRYSPNGPRPYTHPEELIWRDIDPTVLVRQPQEGEGSPWFSPGRVDFPTSVVAEYPDDIESLPDPLDLIAVTDPDGGRWLALHSGPHWNQTHPADIAALEPPTRAAWTIIHAYLVEIADIPTIRQWAAGQDWYGRWMPDTAEPSNLLLASHPDDPQWEGAAGEAEEDWYDRSGDTLSTIRVRQVAAWYGGTGTSRDASADDETRAYVPTKVLMDIVGLAPGVDFEWHDADSLAATDPSTRIAGPRTFLLRRNLTAKLAAAGYTLFWTALSAHELHPGNYATPSDDYRWVSASASYLIESDSIQLISARAERYERGPRMERELTWHPRISDT